MEKFVTVGALFIFGSIALALATYFIGRRIHRSHLEKSDKDLASAVTIRVAALHGLILALVFADEMVGYHELNSSLIQEATAISDIYHDINRYGFEPKEKTDLQWTLYNYTLLVVNDEWPMLAESNRLSPKAWEMHNTLYEIILDLEPANTRQKVLRDHTIENLQKLAKLRQKRENIALQDLDALFWVAAFVGIVMTAVPYLIYPPKPFNILLLCNYGAFSGIVMMIIYAYADPFTEPGQLSPDAFVRVLENEFGIFLNQK